MTTTVAISPGPFTATRLVPAALASLYSGETNATVFQLTNQDQTNECTWCLDLEKKPATKSNPVEFPSPDAAVEFWKDSTTEQQQIPLSFSGHLWKHHGITILRERFNITGDAKLECIKNKFYEMVIQAVDAKSLHIRRCDCSEPHPSFSFLSFDDIVGTLNPDWEGMEFSSERAAARNEALQRAFDQTMAIIKDMIHSLNEEFYTGFAVITAAFADTEFIQKRILKLSQYIPWQTYIYDEEEARGLDDTNNILWVIFQDERSLQWRATSPAAKGDRFKNRSLVHEELRGLRDEELCQKVGLPGCGFVHHTGFTCGGSSLEAVLQLIAYNGTKMRKVEEE